MRFPSSIQSRVTLLVLAFGLVLLVINTKRNDTWLRERQWKRVIDGAEATGPMLAGTMQHYIRNNLGRAAELQMSYASTADELRSGIVLDHNDRIVQATRLDLVGMPLATSPMAGERALIDEVRRSMNSIVQRREDQLSVVALFPFFTRFESVSRGVVVLQYDLAAALHRARLDAFHESASQACVMIALCLLLWLILDEVVTQRVRVIVAYAQKVAAGRSNADQVPARDDLDLIAGEFGRTVDELRAVELRLLEAAERERRRIGADLHDDVCQRLVAAQLKSGVLASVLRGEKHAQAALAESVSDNLAGSARLVRSVARGLAPMLVSRGRLAEAMNEAASSLEAAFSVPCECHVNPGDKPFAMWVDTHVFRILQELMTNAAKHAKPSRITATVNVENEKLLIHVISDGEPLVVGEQTGLGLEMVWQRVRALGGELTLAKGLTGSGGVATFELGLQLRHYVDEEAPAGSA